MDEEKGARGLSECSRRALEHLSREVGRVLFHTIPEGFLIAFVLADLESGDAVIGSVPSLGNPQGVAKVLAAGGRVRQGDGELIEVDFSPEQ